MRLRGCDGEDPEGGGRFNSEEVVVAAGEVSIGLATDIACTEEEDGGLEEMIENIPWFGGGTDCSCDV